MLIKLHYFNKFIYFIIQYYFPLIYNIFTIQTSTNYSSFHHCSNQRYTQIVKHPGISQYRMVRHIIGLDTMVTMCRAARTETGDPPDATGGHLGMVRA